MAEKPETLFKNRVSKALSVLPNSWFIKTQEVGRRGVPDYVGCVAGQFVALELKHSKFVKVDELQQWNLDAIANACGISFVTYPENWNATWDALQDLAHGGDKKSYEPIDPNKEGH